ncbi:GIY-YIG nuclease family protein [Azospirillum doebereinerae]|uniref:GIY-YIG nuclease family protein n=1 Tax=Azospirillum doebereinerae TaxID=92933 RepID=A0A3S0V3S5_9PROT|nr:GIY-YIG nuclease family protein [Azospirillum doebereinerae]RUQ75780.1 GIY-YIG nuclease family protein [Azospirillum doebereinerae]
MAEISSVVDWFGPYRSLKDARTVARQDFGGGLYAAIGWSKIEGRSPNQYRGRPTLQYIGIAENLGGRLTETHHKIGLRGNIEIASIWLGEVASYGVPGRRRKKIEPHLDIVEWATAFFLRTQYNEMKRTPPRCSCFVLNRWWSTDYETSIDRPVSRWADVIEYNIYTGSANLCWFGRNGRVKSIDNAMAYGRAAINQEMKSKSLLPASITDDELV